MAKRLTDTEIWDQDWFVELPTKYKLFWCYIKDKCDNAGFWRPNKVIAQRIIGEPINIQEFLEFINVDKERIVVLPTGKWFLRDYFLFQYGDTFSPSSKVHIGALRTMVSNGVHVAEILKTGSGNLKNVDIQELKEIAYHKDIKRLSEAYQNGIDRTKEKE